MRKTVFSNWNIMRGLRLLMGIFALVQAFTQKDITVGLLGGFLLLTAITNIGRCGANGCAVNYRKHQKEEEVSYEELDNK